MLEKFLATKPLYYDKIDYTRMPRAYETIKHALHIPKIIHLIGTNGKGTSGRFLASALYTQGYKTGHYTSPHILEFNERIWLNGKNIEKKTLDEAHKQLLSLLPQTMVQELSYFEYTTLLALVIYQECDYIVLEAGLGGEYDATAVFENTLTLVTPIDKDHEAFLGNTIEAIATTKLNAIQKNAILGKQKHAEVFSVANKLSQEKNLNIISYETLLQDSDTQKIQTIAKNNALEPYLQENLALAIAAFKFLNIPYEIEHFNNAKLFGRISKIHDNIILDVGHNALAAQALKDALSNKKFTLVYNSYKDKDYKNILKILSPIIKEVEIISVDDIRIAKKEDMQSTLETLDLHYRDFQTIEKEKNYLVFGSFSVAETFLRRLHG